MRIKVLSSSKLKTGNAFLTREINSVVDRFKEINNDNPDATLSRLLNWIRDDIVVHIPCNFLIRFSSLLAIDISAKLDFLIKNFNLTNDFLKEIKWVKILDITLNIFREKYPNIIPSTEVLIQILRKTNSANKRLKLLCNKRFHDIYISSFVVTTVIEVSNSAKQSLKILSDPIFNDAEINQYVYNLVLKQSDSVSECTTVLLSEIFEDVLVNSASINIILDKIIDDKILKINAKEDLILQYLNKYLKIYSEDSFRYLPCIISKHKEATHSFIEDLRINFPKLYALLDFS